MASKPKCSILFYRLILIRQYISGIGIKSDKEVLPGFMALVGYDLNIVVGGAAPVLVPVT